MRSLIRLLPYLKRHSLALLLGCLALFASNFMTVRGWGLTQRAVDSFSHSGTSSRIVLLYALAVFGVFVLGAVMRFFMRWLMIGASRKIEYEFRNDLFGHLQKLSPSYYDRHMTGDLMSRCTNDMDAVRMVIGPGIMMPLNTFVLVPMVMIQMLHISPLLSVVGLAPLFFAPFCMHFYGTMIHKMFRKVQDHYSIMSARVQENLAGIRVVKSLAREEQEISSFESLNEHYRRLSMRLMMGMAFFFPIMRVMVGLGTVAVIYFGATHSSEIVAGAASSARGISYGDLFAFIGLYNELIWPVLGFGWVINMLQAGSASMKRIALIFDEKPEIPPPSYNDKGSGGAIRGEIEFRNLTFGYDAERAILHNIDLRIPAGHTLGLVGPVGSGKSTLLSLIPRLYHTPGGQLFIDGRDINEIPIEELRGAISMAPQETFLFSDSLRENIGFGVEEAEDPAIHHVAESAQIASSIENFPHQYDTELGERGINLSGGQKQRTAIARALLRNPKILLLDDCLSSVDTETEEAILRNLRNELRGRTAILVSHRVSTVALADEIVVLNDGRIVEQGTHDQLVASDGLYAQLYRQQQLAEAIEHENGYDKDRVERVRSGRDQGLSIDPEDEWNGKSERF